MVVDDWKHEPVEFKETSGNLQQAKKVQLLVSYDYKLHSQVEKMGEGYEFAKAKSSMLTCIISVTFQQFWFSRLEEKERQKKIEKTNEKGHERLSCNSGGKDPWSGRTMPSIQDPSWSLWILSSNFVTSFSISSYKSPSFQLQ